MAKSKPISKNRGLDQKPKNSSKEQVNVLTLANINKSLWSKKFERLCDLNNLNIKNGKRK